MAGKTDAKKPAKRDMKFNANALKQAEMVRNFWAVTVPAGSSVRDLVNPSAWAHMAHRLSPRDRIEAMPEDGAWYAELLVLHTGTAAAKVMVLLKTRLDAVEDDETETDTHKVEWGSPAVKFRIIRIEDNAVIRDGFADKADAVAWMHSNLTARKAA